MYNPDIKVSILILYFLSKLEELQMRPKTQLINSDIEIFCSNYEKEYV